MSDVAQRDLNWLQDLYMVGIRNLMMDRTIVQAPLFDLPGKMITGVLASGHGIPQMIDDLSERATPEELGERLRVPGTSVSVSVQGLPFMYLLGRIQRYLYAGWADDRSVTLDDHEEATKVLDFYERMIRTYRADGRISPHDEGAVPGWPALRAPEAAAWAAKAIAAGPPPDVAAARRALSRIETLIFLLHADARDGIWHHGPYDLGDGRVLVMKEHTDLRSPYLPWVRGHWLSVSKVVTAIVLEGVEVQIDAFGALRTEPINYLDHCVGMTWFAGDDLEEISLDRLVEISNETGSIGRDLYREMMGWDARLRTAHGAIHYAGNLRGFYEAAGFSVEEIQTRLIDRFEAAAEPYLPRLMAGDLDPQVFVYILADEMPPLPSVAVGAQTA